MVTKFSKLNKLGVKNSLWNNIRANKGSGKEPSKEMLEQERKIKFQKGGKELLPDKTQQTKLSKGQEIAYNKWKSENKYNESDDYDLKGYFLEKQNYSDPKEEQHFTDKFKRLAPFSNGDGYMQLSDESNVASDFDKRQQGFWGKNENITKDLINNKKTYFDKFNAYQKGGSTRESLSELGYKDKSPFKNRKQIVIDSPNGLITMDGVSKALKVQDEFGNVSILPPNSGLHKLKGKRFIETPFTPKKKLASGGSLGGGGMGIASAGLETTGKLATTLSKKDNGYIDPETGLQMDSEDNSLKGQKIGAVSGAAVGVGLVATGAAFGIPPSVTAPLVPLLTDVGTEVGEFFGKKKKKNDKIDANNKKRFNFKVDKFATKSKDATAQYTENKQFNAY